MIEIREYTPADLPALTRLWAEAFEVSEPFVQEFYRLLPEAGFGLVLEEDGCVAAMTSVIDSLYLEYGNGKAPERCAYLYGIAAAEACRGKGYGQRITAEARSRSLARNAAVVTLMPASESLFSFYAAHTGFRPALSRERREVPAKAAVPMREIEPEAYAARREDLLSGTDHLRISVPATRILHMLCRQYGGGLYSSDEGICACLKDNGTCIVQDMISPRPDSLAAAAAALSSCDSAVYYVPGRGGDPFLSSDVPIPSESFIWGFTLE